MAEGKKKQSGKHSGFRQVRRQSSPGHKTRLKIMSYALISLAVIVFAVCIYVIVFLKTNIISINEKDMTMNVSNYIGINLDTDKIHMGTTFPGGYSIRSLFVTSGKKGYIYLTSNADMNNWIYVNQQNIPVSPGRNSTVTFLVAPDKSISKGDYSGTIRIYVMKHKVNKLIGLFLGYKPLQLISERNVDYDSSAKVSLTIVNQTNNNNNSAIQGNTSG